MAWDINSYNLFVVSAGSVEPVFYVVDYDSKELGSCSDTCHWVMEIVEHRMLLASELPYSVW